MPVRAMRSGELPAVIAMMQALWPDAGDYDSATSRAPTTRVQYFWKEL